LMTDWRARILSRYGASSPACGTLFKMRDVYARFTCWRTVQSGCGSMCASIGHVDDLFEIAQASVRARPGCGSAVGRTDWRGWSRLPHGPCANRGTGGYLWGEIADECEDDCGVEAAHFRCRVLTPANGGTP